MGYLVGFKALTAALLGGIGSLSGAWIGGLLIGLFETYWAGYLDTLNGLVAAIWGAATRTLSAFGFNVTGDDFTAILH